MTDPTISIDKKVAFHTLGCKLNFAETSALGRSMAELGFRRVKAGEQADVCVINTCSVTDTADRKCRQAIGQIMRRHPMAFVVVTGCYAQLKPDEIAAMPGVDLVLGSKEKFDLALYLDSLEKRQKAVVFNTKVSAITEFRPSCSQSDRTRFFLKVQDGCDYFCSYCTIPFARGRSRSATIAQTVEQVQLAVTQGAREIVLTGVNTGDFGRGTDESFLDLIRTLDEIEGIRYRISSIEPNLLSNEIIAFVARSKRFAPHFHIPLQSGSNEVLQLMRRRYTRELFAERVAEIKRMMPHAFIGVDVIVGTRGETEEYFTDALHFIEKLDVSQLHVFSYSERMGTKALEIAHTVSADDKKRRSEMLHHLSNQKLHDFYTSQIGCDASVLWESTRKGNAMHGFTENYVRVSAPFDKSKINTVEKLILAGFSDEDTIALSAVNSIN
ncbi:MAG: tRNA (N(6)-L-threonylcarbamoyladenosine(37)-C(2))-methylthiotransferase MtaB [Prevotellaceae bacterium]|jgi:threonylcarbamoyladenosine tRNA methylthiotransferase MtaB|nr:tRNA (N(6)-L-threonylcarbamoyladenosine(37)-C(2))-methylthiotransferase MtaB [Prevotellaceae bacterium]